MKHDGKLSEYKKNIWTASEARQHQVDARQEQLHENFVKFHYLFFFIKEGNNNYSTGGVCQLLRQMRQVYCDSSYITEQEVHFIKTILSNTWIGR